MTAFRWSCSCGDCSSTSPTWDEARTAGDVHACRAGRLRELHVIFVQAEA